MLREMAENRKDKPCIIKKGIIWYVDGTWNSEYDSALNFSYYKEECSTRCKL